MGPGQEGGEGGHEGDVALGRQSHADADHVLLGDVTLEGPVREGLEKLVGVGRVLDVAVDGHDPRIDLGQVEQGVAVGQAGGRLLRVGRPREAHGHDGLPLPERLGLVDEAAGVDLGRGPELLEGPGQLVGLEGLAVPAVAVLDEAHALALEGLGQDGGGLALLAGPLERRQNLVDLVAVDGDGVPTESGELAPESGQVVAVHGPIGLAEPVDVDDGDEVAELPVGGRRGGFPDLALGALAVAEKHEGAARRLVQALGQGQAGADRQALAEGAGSGLDPGHAGRRVAFEIAGDLAQVEQALGRQDAGFGVSRPEQGGGVALGQDELVGRRVARVRRVPAHLAEEQAGREVGRGQTGRRVPRARRRGHAQGVDAEAGRDLREMVGSGHGEVLLTGWARPWAGRPARRGPWRSGRSCRR